MGFSAVVPPIIGFIIDVFGFLPAFYVLASFSLIGGIIAIFLPRI